MDRKKEELNRDDDVSIDQSALDVEWLDQPILMKRYGERAAKARLELDQAKDQLDFVKAKLEGQMRSDPDKFALPKVTDAVIKAALLIYSDCIEAQDDYNKAKYDAEIARVAVAAIDQKKSALENLVKLHGQMYFAGPSIPRDLDKEWEKREKEKRVSDGIQARRKK